eukprot:jgi/Chrzof1/7794/Cz02g36280.t1
MRRVVSVDDEFPADLVLECVDGDLEVHQKIMAMASHVFRDCIRSTSAPLEPGQLMRIPVEEDLTDMHIVCKMVYPSKKDTCDTDITFATLEKLLAMGNKCDMPKVTSRCEAYYAANATNKFSSGKLMQHGLLSVSRLIS